jgi:nitroreductase
MTFFDAARWAPSSYNSQPWRFVYARRGTTHWGMLLGLLNEFNQSWAKEASALVVALRWWGDVVDVMSDPKNLGLRAGPKFMSSRPIGM